MALGYVFKNSTISAQKERETSPSLTVEKLAAQNDHAWKEESLLE